MNYQYTIMTNNYYRCYECGDKATEWHHALHGADKKLSEEYGLMIPLCRGCHEKVHHVGGELDRKLKKEAQRMFLIKTFGKCYFID